MAINWDEVQRLITPIKDYEDICRRLEESFSYSFVGDAFNFTMLELVSYTQKLLGGDSHGRYTDYASKLCRIFTDLCHAGVQNVLDLKEQTSTRAQFEIFIERSAMSAIDIVTVLKYLIYWFIPNEKYLSGLVRDDPDINNAIKSLRGFGIRTNLELLQKGITTVGRKSLVETTRLSADTISELVNRADFSRLPWASKATISNIIGAGYGSLAQLANADPDQLYADFFRYGKNVGKNLKLGNEIENSYRIAKIVPVLLEEE